MSTRTSVTDLLAAADWMGSYEVIDPDNDGTTISLHVLIDRYGSVDAALADEDVREALDGQDSNATSLLRMIAATEADVAKRREDAQVRQIAAKHNVTTAQARAAYRRVVANLAAERTD